MHRVVAVSVNTLALAFSAALAPTVATADPRNGAVAPPPDQVTVDAVSPEALARAQRKLAHAQQVAAHFNAEARAQHLDESWRFAMIGDLMKGPEEQFDRVEFAPGLMQAQALATTLARARPDPAGEAKVLGTKTSDLTYVPINPCRILDTRQGAPFAQGQIQTFSFKSTNVGHDGTCSVYSTYSGLDFPAALAVNVTVDETAFSGFPAGKFLAIYPTGGTLGASFMNFGPGQIIANAGIISINQSTGQFDVKSSAPAHVIIDVFGLFLAPLPSALECVQTSAGTATLGLGQSSGATSGTCPATYTLVGGTCTSEPLGAVNSTRSASISDNPIVATSTFSCWGQADMGSGTLSARGTCCRVPGRQ